MRAILASSLLLPALAAQTPAPAGIRWEPDLAAAQAAARSDGKPVLAYFTFET